MSVHSASPPAMATLSRENALATGQFAPGHLGGLTPHLPFELVDAVLEETRAVQRRLRDLPSRVGVYFLVALCLFPEVGYQLVWDKMTYGLDGLLPTPSAKGLRDLRRRVGCAPMKALSGVMAGTLAQPRTPGARFGPFRTVSFADCSSIKVPRVLALLQEEPERQWQAREIAELLGDITLVDSYHQLSRWSKKGLIKKVRTGRYSAALPPTDVSLQPRAEP
ncbi:transposase domain-containing protein [Streptomyces hebeiensis]